MTQPCERCGRQLCPTSGHREYSDLVAEFCCVRCGDEIYRESKAKISLERKTKKVHIRSQKFREKFDPEFDNSTMYCNTEIMFKITSILCKDGYKENQKFFIEGISKLFPNYSGYCCDGEMKLNTYNKVEILSSLEQYIRNM